MHELTTTQKVMKQYRTHETDTASPQVQVALLTEKVNQLTSHFKTHVKDHHSRRGLLKMVGRRRRLLDFLHRENPEAYVKLIGDLNIRK
jgi:small subunit ribosomal protein S15